MSASPSSPPPIFRLCLSGDPACAGLSPCEVCRQALASEIINHALKAAKCDSVEQAEAFFAAYNASKTAFLAKLQKQIEDFVKQHEAALAAQSAQPSPPPAEAPKAPAAAKSKAKSKGERAPTPPNVTDAAKSRHETMQQKAGTST
jgi:hypothetical protein